MLATVRLFFQLIGISIKSQMQYPASFLMLALTHFLSTFMDILGIWVLFDRFKMVQGWTFPELGLIYGIMQVGFALAEGSARGFDTFGRMVKSGDFDRVLLRPCGTLFQIAACDFQGMRIGRLLQGLVVLLWSFHALHLSIIAWHGLLILFAIIGTTSLFYGLFVIQATLSFWTVESLELMNITTYGGVESGQYPMSIYPSGFRAFFTFIIPLACVGYYPIAIMLHHETFSLGAAFLFPLSGFFFLFLSCQLWKIGVRHYHSAGG